MGVAPGGVAALQLLAVQHGMAGRPAGAAALSSPAQSWVASSRLTGTFSVLHPRRPRKGGVKLVFEAPDGEELHFERVIKPTGAGAEAFTSEVRLLCLWPGCLGVNS